MGIHSDKFGSSKILSLELLGECTRLAASTEAEVGQEQGGQRRKRCVYGHSEKKKKNSRGPQSVTTEGAPSILFNKDHFLGAVLLSFYLYACTYIADPHDSHFPSL